MKVKKKKTVNDKPFFEKLLSSKSFLRVLSVVAAVICWLLVVTVVDENTTTVVSNIPVEIDLEGTTAQKYGLSLIEGSGQTVSIRVQGRRVEIGALTADDFNAYAVLTDVNKTGEYALNIEVSKKSSLSSYSVVEVTPSTISASFDYLEEVTFEVEGLAEGITADAGYIKDTIIVSPDTIDLIGPQSQISKIDRCVAISDETAELTSTSRVKAQLHFYDAAGNLLELPDVDFREQDFELMVPIYKQKTVPLEPKFVNVPNGINLDLLRYSMSDTQITIAGQERLVDSIESVSLSEIDFRKVDVGSSFLVDVNLSAGLMNLDYLENVTVSFDAEYLTSMTLNISNILISNASSLYDVELATTRLSNVKIVGEKAVLGNLTASDFVANVDLANAALSQGSIRVNVNIHALNQKQAWAVGEYAVTLNVTAKS